MPEFWTLRRAVGGGLRARGAFEMLVRRFNRSSVLADLEPVEDRKMLATVHHLAQPKAQR